MAGRAWNDATPANRALVVTAPDTIVLQLVAVPDPGPGEIAVDLLFTAISPGTEARTMREQQPGVEFPYTPG